MLARHHCGEKVLLLAAARRDGQHRTIADHIMAGTKQGPKPSPDYPEIQFKILMLGDSGACGRAMLIPLWCPCLRR